MTIHKIQSVYTVVNDMEALQAFYSQVLGMPPKFRDADRWTQFSVGNANFALSSVAEAVPGTAGSVVVFEADRIDGVRDAVTRAGGTFVGARDMGAHGTVLSFNDPEGHPFQVFSKNPPTPQPPAGQAKEQS
jgi:predicted enzyme related to lactoylglutathione lyase